VVVSTSVTSLIISDVTVVKTSDMDTSIEVIDSISVILLKISDVTVL
jgi:hypothetical protein